MKKMKRRRKMMTKAAVIVFSIIAILLGSALFYYSNMVADPAAMISSYEARREDIYQSQLEIEKSLSELNQTIALELENQKALSAKLAELSKKADLPPPVINTTKIVQEPPVIIKVPVTVPVSRAS
jgi:hypothetical protein